MSRTDFRQLLKRYVEGTATAEEKALVDHWYELLYDAAAPALSQEELDDMEQEMWDHIEKNGHWLPAEAAMPPVKTPVRRWWWRGAAAAAVIAILLVTIWSIWKPAPKKLSYDNSRPSLPLKEIENNTAQTKKVTLSDGSYVLLQPASKIAWPEPAENGKREVYLEGEAFFDVVKDPDRPFFVYAHELVTRVLGTSFTVQAFGHNDTIKVMVRTGKVTVYRHNSNSNEQYPASTQAAIIMPNQQLIFSRRKAVVTKAIAEQPQVLHTDEPPRIVFTNAPASQVLASLQKAYGISIVYDEELLSHCSFTGTFTGETFFEKISLVCRAIEAAYEQADGQVIITGSGCEK